VNLPSTPLPAGIPIVVKAKRANTGDISLGNSSANALKTAPNIFRLAANEAVSIRLANLNELWIDSTVNNEGVEIIYEPII
jgi:hypothetical protein